MENKMYFASNVDRNGNVYQAIVDNDNKTVKKAIFFSEEKIKSKCRKLKSKK